MDYLKCQQMKQAAGVSENLMEQWTYSPAPDMVSKNFITKEVELMELLTKSFSPRSSISRTILAPTEPPIVQPFRKAARIKIGMLELMVKITMTIKWSRDQKIANVFILKYRERYPKIGRAMALNGFLLGVTIFEIIDLRHKRFSL